MSVDVVCRVMGDNNQPVVFRDLSVALELLKHITCRQRTPGRKAEDSATLAVANSNK